MLTTSSSFLPHPLLKKLNNKVNAHSLSMTLIAYHQTHELTLKSSVSLSHAVLFSKLSKKYFLRLNSLQDFLESFLCSKSFFNLQNLQIKNDQ